jgi:hypothetical protein
VRGWRGCRDDQPGGFTSSSLDLRSTYQRPGTETSTNTFVFRHKVGGLPPSSQTQSAYPRDVKRLSRSHDHAH